MIGIDLGLKILLVGADDAGDVVNIPGPKPLRVGLRRLRRASRAHSRRKPGGANRRKSAARLARIHARVANVRADALHKVTTRLAAQYETIVAEDLFVAGMTRQRRLACSISDQGFGMALRMLAYKTGRRGGQLFLADRFYPSSKTCSGCGYVKAKLALSERTFTCQACGLIIDRDENAARNLLGLGTASGAETGLAEANACGAAVRPEHAGLAALNQEPGTASVGQTGTATRQLVAAGKVLAYVR